MKKYSKKKAKDIKGPKASQPGYRTPDHFKLRESKFSGKSNVKMQSQRNPTGYKRTQHKG